MRATSAGLLSELVLVRMHGRMASYLDAPPADRAGIVAACRMEATVRDLSERILVRTIYAQSSTRVAPLRELIQNALDASPRGARIDIRTGDHERQLIVCDRGRGMSKSELLEDLLVPFRSGKELIPEAIGEHGIGFLSSLEIAPRIEITTRTRTEWSRLSLSPVGESAPYGDFAWDLATMPLDATRATGTTVHLELDRPIDPASLAADVATAAGLVDPNQVSIYVNDVLVNVAHARLRRVATVAVGSAGELGELHMLVGRGEGIPPQLVMTQKGLFVAARPDAFTSPEHGLHRDLMRAIVSGGYGILVELPTGVPLNKGRSAVAAGASRAVEGAIVTAFERFVLEDALYDRELLRGVDHRVASVLDRMLAAALAGDELARAETAVDDLAPTVRPVSSDPDLGDEGAKGPKPRAPSESEPARPRVPTVAAPEEVVRFAAALLDAPIFTAIALDSAGVEVRKPSTLRAILAAHRAGVLRPVEEGLVAGALHLTAKEPLAESLWRRLAAMNSVPPPDRARTSGTVAMARVGRERLSTFGVALAGVPALTAGLSILERIDAVVSAAAGIAASPISVHQDLYGPDEMAHTDGSGVSVNLASPRIRALFASVLTFADPVAFGALVDLVIHEKAHVSLASYVPRATAEHGTSFYRRKDWLRRRLLEAIASGLVPDPYGGVAAARHGLSDPTLPSPEALALAFQSEPLAA